LTYFSFALFPLFSAGESAKINVVCYKNQELLFGFAAFLNRDEAERFRKNTVGEFYC